MNRILWANCSGIGDVLLSLVAVKVWHRRHPETRMVFIGNRRTEPILRMQSVFDEVWVYEKDEWTARRRASLRAFWAQAKEFHRRIRDAGFDAFVDFSMNRYLRWTAQAAGIPLRVGWVYRNRGWGLTRGCSLHWEGFTGESVAWQHLRLLEPLGLKRRPADVHAQDLAIEVTPEALAAGRRMLEQKGVRPDHWETLAVAAGGGLTWGDRAPAKRWPAERHAHVADKMFEIHRARVILLGDAKDRETAAVFKAAAKAPVIDLTGCTDLPVMLGVLAHCRAALVNDGGPLHLAASVGTPVVAVMGPVDERVYGPLPTAGHEILTADVPCRPCYRRFGPARCDHLRCLTDVQASVVFERLSRVWVREEPARNDIKRRLLQGLDR